MLETVLLVLVIADSELEQVAGRADLRAPTDDALHALAVIGTRVGAHLHRVGTARGTASDIELGRERFGLVEYRTDVDAVDTLQLVPVTREIVAVRHRGDIDFGR